MRKVEHQKVVRKEEAASLLSQHVRKTSLTIDFDSTKVIAKIEQRTRGIIRKPF